MKTFDPENKEIGFYIEGGYYPQYIGHAPNGGIKDFGEPRTDEPFCYTYSGPLVLCADPSMSTGPRTVHYPRVENGEVIEVLGYGKFKVYRSGDNSRLVEV